MQIGSVSITVTSVVVFLCGTRKIKVAVNTLLRGDMSAFNNPVVCMYSDPVHEI